MKPPALVAVGTGVGAAMVWLATPELPAPARLLTAFLVAVLPPLLLAQGRLPPELLAEVTRRELYLSSSLALWILAAVTAAAALASGFTPATLGLIAPGAGTLLGWTLAALAGGVGVLALFRALRVRESPLVAYLLPRTPRERAGWIGVSLTAGICEELVFRGFLIPALLAVSGSTALAVGLSSTVFGLLHAYQGVVGVVRTGLLGLLLALPFLLTGSILPSILAHAALDLIVGFWLAGWLLRR